MFYDPVYFMFLIPGLILAGIASLLVKTTFSRYARVRSYSGMTGAQAAERMLRANGVFDVRVEQTQGFLSDHYDPTRKVLRLSPDVYGSNSLSAVGVACHEAGHALQHAAAYAPLTLRTLLVPATNFASMFAFYVFFAGLLFNSQSLVYIGCALFAVGFLFAVVTLPVEWDASTRQTTPGDNRHRLARPGTAGRARAQCGFPDLSGRRGQFAFNPAVLPVSCRLDRRRAQQRLTGEHTHV